MRQGVKLVSEKQHLWLTRQGQTWLYRSTKAVQLCMVFVGLSDLLFDTATYMVSWLQQPTTFTPCCSCLAADPTHTPSPRPICTPIKSSSQGQEQVPDSKAPASPLNKASTSRILTEHHVELRTTHSLMHLQHVVQHFFLHTLVIVNHHGISVTS